MRNSKMPIGRQIVYFFIVIYALTGFKISWLWGIPYSSLLIATAVILYLGGKTNKMFYYDARLFWPICLYAVVFLLNFFSSLSINLFGLASLLIKSFIICSVLLLKEPYKEELFGWFIKSISFILFISIPAWILFLLGFKFAHGPVIDIGDGFHYMYDYVFFVTSYDSFSISPRFCSVFLEPGWIGTICCFLLFGLQLNIKRIETWLCLAAILLSMSLSAVVNFILCLILWGCLKNKQKIKYLLFIFSVIGGVAMFATTYNKGNNIINSMIVERLAFDEDLGIAGNNRTNEDFDNEFESMMKSTNRWFGTRHTHDENFSMNNDWYNRSSGIKKELYDNGIIGTGIFMFFLFFIFKRYLDRRCFVFLLCFILASFVRNLWRSDLYLLLYVVSLSTIYGSRAITNHIVSNIHDGKFVKK